MGKGCCGGTGTCACKIVGGRLTTVPGTGTSQDPFEINSEVSLGTEDSPVFDLGISGDGTRIAPWILRLAFAATASINDIPNVSAAAPANGNVLTYSVAEGKWVAGPASVTSGGLISSDNTIDGDGSTGAPLTVHPDTSRFIQATTAGVGLNDSGINRMVRQFADAATRAAAAIAPVVNTLSMLASNPGQVDYWNGAAWVPITNGISTDVQSGQLLSLSGSYAGGPTVKYVGQISDTTDAAGLFEVIPAADLSTYAGVLSAQVTPTGSGSAWVPMVDTDTDRIVATAWRLDDTEYASSPVTAVVEALLY